MTPLPATLLGLATAVPPHRLDQSTVAAVARRIFARSLARYPKLDDVYTNAGIEQRFSVCPLDWFDAPHDWPQRTRAYLEGADRLFITSAQKALAGAGAHARDVDVIVTISSTGIATSSLEARIAEEMGFRPDVLASLCSVGGAPAAYSGSRSVRGLPAPSSARSCWSLLSSSARLRSEPTARARPT